MVSDCKVEILQVERVLTDVIRYRFWKIEVRLENSKQDFFLRTLPGIGIEDIDTDFLKDYVRDLQVANSLAPQDWISISLQRWKTFLSDQFSNWISC